MYDLYDLYDLYDPSRFPGERRITCMVQVMYPGLDLLYADPAQPLTTAGEELDNLDHDM